ncbi:MAG: hypothetical protein MK212_22135 [Saprospiraceae bacterium]|nr:hypothetical protein [Saprospiraceae bacterium]
MSKKSSAYNFFYSRLLSEEIKEKSERLIISVAIISFFVHLALIFMVDLGWISLPDGKSANLLSNPIAAIYTPFSFILIFEVYLLVYYIPRSITSYVGKQYEIISLIVIRRLFKDLANIDLGSDWFSNKYDLQFTYDLVATLILFVLIFFFYRLNKRKKLLDLERVDLPSGMRRFIRQKTIIAMLLVPVLVILALVSAGTWVQDTFFSFASLIEGAKDVNRVFFDQFFMLLILTDVLLLLLSLYHTDKFSKVVRNSGFIVSTILIRLSFGTQGLINVILILSAVLFGVIILAVHNEFEKVDYGKK